MVVRELPPGSEPSARSQSSRDPTVSCSNLSCTLEGVALRGIRAILAAGLIPQMVGRLSGGGGIRTHEPREEPTVFKIGLVVSAGRRPHAQRLVEFATVRGPFVRGGRVFDLVKNIGQEARELRPSLLESRQP